MLPFPPCPVPPSCSAVIGRDELRDGVHLDVGRPLVDRADLRVSIELLDAKRLGEAHPPKQLDALGRGLLGDRLRVAEDGEGLLIFFFSPLGNVLWAPLAALHSNVHS